MKTSATPVVKSTETSDSETAPQAAAFSNVMNLGSTFATSLPVADNAAALGYSVHVALCRGQAASA